MVKSGGVGGFTVRRQANTGESRGQDQAIAESRQIEIHKVWQKVGENIEISPSLLGDASLRPSKPLQVESSGERGEDGGENVEGRTIDADKIHVRRWAHVQLLEVSERSKVGKHGLEDAGG
jgi:hypothetical protein